jgi:hypothetical protein
VCGGVGSDTTPGECALPVSVSPGASVKVKVFVMLPTSKTTSAWVSVPNPRCLAVHVQPFARTEGTVQELVRDAVPQRAQLDRVG